jgi:hypothetical protein
MDYCTGVGAATSGIANPLTWVQIPACALSNKPTHRVRFARSLDIQWRIRWAIEQVRSMREESQCQE